MSFDFAVVSTDATDRNGINEDMKTHTITLAEGTAYMLPKGFKDPGLKVGEKVAVVWDLKGNIHEASAVSMVKS